MKSAVILAQPLFASLQQLTPAEQAQAITYITRFQSDPAHPSLGLEPLSSPDVWSGRISGGLSAILYRDRDTWALLHVGHEERARQWASQREIGRHAITGALQIVETVESPQEEEWLRPTQTLPLFRDHTDGYLLSLGVPVRFMRALRRIVDDDQLLTLCEKLPLEVAERLVGLAAGQLTLAPEPIGRDRPLLAAPDTRERYFLVDDEDELTTVLAAPMERWLAFLHPAQRELVERDFAGPAKVSGSAGTGKTVVAMHRARHLSRQGESVLLTSFVTTLCENIRRNLKLLCTAEELSRITVATVYKQAFELVKQVEPKLHPASDSIIDHALTTLQQEHAPTFTPGFVRGEWDQVVRMQGIHTWEQYKESHRTGRSRSLSLSEKEQLWRVFGGVLSHLEQRGLRDWPGICLRAQEVLESGQIKSPYTAVIVDEVQDLNSPALRFIAALGGSRPGHLMLCGDAGQRIYPGGFSLGSLGIDVRGRSTVLRLNYRTTEQIRRIADRVLGPTADDMDGALETRSTTRSLVKGEPPTLRGYPSHNKEQEAALAQIRAWLDAGLQPGAIGIFARTTSRIEELGQALKEAGIPWYQLSGSTVATDAVLLCTMHRAKGLEFKAVLLMDCSEASLPNPSAIRHLADPADQQSAIERERQLLYVAMTRARDHLAISWTGNPSSFLDPLLDTAGQKT